MSGLPKSRILKKKKDFQTVYSNGKTYANRFLVLYVFCSDDLQGKIGFAAGKKLGCAVRRNRIKRLLREAYRMQQDKIKEGFSLLLVGRKAALSASFLDIEKALFALLEKADVFT